MPCCGDREKIGDMKLEQTWDYINLNDFKSSSCFTGFSYFMVWVFLGISIAVYAVDTFTAINLLVFDKWSSQIKPKIPFDISRWIFAGCIIASFVLLAYRWFRTIRIMRSGGIAESYLDPLAVRVQSIRVGKSRGYRRFLVFAELTKSKKGADYVALFAYFSFESWMRVVFADGPRQVINAITLYSVMELDLIATGANAAPDGTSSVAQFFINIKALAEKNYQQAVILFGMLFTLVIWVIAALSLISSVILYLIFLWHHIPTADGSLKRYCRRKINTRLERIVRKKTATALAKGGLQLNNRTPTMPMTEGEELKPVKVAPTLPSVAEYSDKKPAVSVTPLSRQPTQSTLPPYSEAGFHDEESYRQPKLPDLNGGSSPWLTRTNTQNSAYGESASLTGGAAPMGYSPLDNNYGQPDLPPLPNQNQGRPYSPAMNRPPNGPDRRGPTGPMPMEGLGRRPIGPGYSQTPPPQMMGRQTPGFSRDGPTDRSYSPASRMPYDRSYTPATNPPFDRQQTPQNDMHGMRSNTPANNLPPGRSLTSSGPNFMSSAADPIDRINTPGDRTASPRPPNQGGYVAFNQGNMRSNTPANNLPPIDRTQTPGDRTASPRPPNQGGYVAFNQSNMNEMRSSSPTNNLPPVERTGTPGERIASPRPPNQGGGYVAFNPFSSAMNTDNTRSQSPIFSNPGSIRRPSTTTPSQDPSFETHSSNAPSRPQIVRSATAGPTHDSSFESYPPIVRAATTTPSNGFGRHELTQTHPQQSHLSAHEEDDDYDPLSYYGSST